MEMFQLPELPYPLHGLEPVLSKEMVDLHYNKHHRGYVANLNTFMDKYQEAKEKKDLSSLIILQSSIQFHGGGHWNHSFFWTCLAPSSQGGGVMTKGPLFQAIEKDFGSFDRFYEKFIMDASGVFGSGWCWLGYNPFTKHLEIVTTQNHGTLGEKRLVPLLVVDVWEHAYYLKYKNLRSDYLKSLWTIINWSAVEGRFIKSVI
ncbi:MAG: superoxide dismutase [Chlamydiota bacterium]